MVQFCSIRWAMRSSVSAMVTGVVANVRGGCGPLDAAGGWIERETGWTGDQSQSQRIVISVRCQHRVLIDVPCSNK